MGYGGARIEQGERVHPQYSLDIRRFALLLPRERRGRVRYDVSIVRPPFPNADCPSPFIVDNQTVFTSPEYCVQYSLVTGNKEGKVIGKGDNECVVIVDNPDYLLNLKIGVDALSTRARRNWLHYILTQQQDYPDRIRALIAGHFRPWSRPRAGDDLVRLETRMPDVLLAQLHHLYFDTDYIEMLIYDADQKIRGALEQTPMKGHEAKTEYAQLDHAMEAILRSVIEDLIGYRDETYPGQNPLVLPYEWDNSIFNAQLAVMPKKRIPKQKDYRYVGVSGLRSLADYYQHFGIGRGMGRALILASDVNRRFDRMAHMMIKRFGPEAAEFVQSLLYEAKKGIYCSLSTGGEAYLPDGFTGQTYHYEDDLALCQSYQKTIMLGRGGLLNMGGSTDGFYVVGSDPLNREFSEMEDRQRYKERMHRLSIGKVDDVVREIMNKGPIDDFLAGVLHITSL